MNYFYQEQYYSDWFKQDGLVVFFDEEYEFYTY